ncbi:MAG: hypothetical protein ACLQE9_02615 [Roseiarcus sp.]
MKPALLAAFAALSLAGCNSGGPAPGAAPPAPGSIVVAPSNFQMPQGGGCAGEIARYRAVQDDDLAMGQIAQSVYDQIRREIAAAAEVCSAGRDAEARAMVLVSRKRHGYPTAL